MKYSLVELAPVAGAESKHDALQRGLRAATEAETAGYHRIWYAEHHHTTGYASQDPATLIALAAERTERIRVGSGAVLLNHYSPFSVAERFLQLEALFPGRIDLGLGRATGGPLVDTALQRDRRSQFQDDYVEQIQEILGYYHDAFDPEHPFNRLKLTRRIGSLPEVWILGSSGDSAGMAGKLGLGYTFAGFINPRAAANAFRSHRNSFQVTPYGPSQYEGILALNIVAADDDETAHRLTYPVRLMWQSLQKGRPAMIQTVAAADEQLPDAEKARPSSLDGATIPQQLSGTASSLRDQLTELVRLTGATELMVQDMLVDPELRRRSREIIAEAAAGVEVE